MMSFRYVMRLDHEHHMRLALAEAKRALREGERPFGAVVVDEQGRVLASAASTVYRDADATAHAPLTLVKEASRLRGRDLTGCTIYATVEPCPMCLTAIWLARVSRVVYGATMAEARERAGASIPTIWMPAELVNEFADPKLQLVGGVLNEECAALFDRAAEHRPIHTAV